MNSSNLGTQLFCIKGTDLSITESTFADGSPVPAIWNDANFTELTAHGHDVVGTNVVIDGTDFLQRGEASLGVETIVTNPPFQLANKSVRHGLLRLPQVVIPEGIQFMQSEARAELADSGKFAGVPVFRNRVPRMHRPDWNGDRASSAMTLALFVFDRDDGSAPTIGWIRSGPSDQTDDRGSKKIKVRTVR